jgi:hypothetical protein
MNKIKDVSEVEEKNDSLSIACKSYVETCEDVFSLLEKIEEPILKLKSEAYDFGFSKFTYQQIQC